MSKKTKKGPKKVMNAEAEMEKRKQQTVEQVLKDTLKENERSALRLSFHHNWRTLFHQCKTEEQRSHIEALKNSMEKQLDDMDLHIKEVCEQLREKERHSAEMEQCFLELVSQLSDVQKKHFDRREQEWEGARIRIRKCHSLKVEETSSKFMLKSLTLDDPLFSVENPYEKLLKETSSAICSLVDNYEKTCQTKREKISKMYREAINKEQKNLVTAEVKLHKATSDQERLTEELESAAEELQNVRKKAEVLQSKRLSQDVDLAKVMQQQVKIESHNLKLRSQTERGRKSARKNLTRISEQSDRAAEALRQVLRQGDRVLRTAALCQKMEDKLQLTEELQNVEQTEDLGAQEKCELPELRLLELRNAVVREKCVSLRKQRDALRHQNRQLQHQITDRLSARCHLEVRRGSDSGPPHKL